MKKTIQKSTLWFSTFMLLIAASIASAQQKSPNELDFNYVQIYRPAPHNYQDLIGAITQSKVAAEAAKLGPEFTWAAYTSDFNVIMFSPIPSLGVLHRDNLFNAVKGTKGESELAKQQILGNGILTTMVNERMKGLHYIPKTKDPNLRFDLYPYLHIQECNLIPMTISEFEGFLEVNRKFVKFYEKINFPIEVSMHRSVIGKERIYISYGIMDYGEFVTKYPAEVLAAQYPEYLGLLMEFAKYVDEFKTENVRLNLDLSFIPGLK